MSLAPDIGLFLHPTFETDALPFMELMDDWLMLGFDRSRCLVALQERMRRVPGLEAFFSPSELKRGGLVASKRALFPRFTGWRLRVTVPVSGGTCRVFDTPLAADDVESAAELVRTVATSNDDEEVLECLNFIEPPLRGRLVSASPRSSWPQLSRPGLLRREHASVLISSGAASVVIDPVHLLRSKHLHFTDAPRAAEYEKPSLILVSHGHPDHWHLPSVLAVAGEDTSVVVPQIRSNLLAPEVLAESAVATGLRQVELEWGAHLEVEDLRVQALPFYGEQPTGGGYEGTAGLRNHGNAYLVSCPRFSALLLSDTGADPRGSMYDVVAELVRDRGPIDVVLASTAEFASPFEGGLAHYWAALTFDQLSLLYREYREGSLLPTTSGPKGLARILSISGARHFLPYANGFDGVQVPIADVGGRHAPSEAQTLDLIEQLLQGHRPVNSSTVLRWRPGDVAHITGAGFLLQ